MDVKTLTSTLLAAVALTFAGCGEDRAEERRETRYETAEELTEGRMEAEAAAAGADELEQEIAGDVGEEYVDDVAELAEDMEELDRQRAATDG